MKKLLVIAIILLVSCTKKQPVHPPVGGILSQNDLEISKNRAKNLNQTERLQIQDWMKDQPEKYYPMTMNYWVNIPNLEKNPRKADDELISYQYDIYDFDQVKIYKETKVNKYVRFGHFEELKAVEDVLRYLKPGEEATLLVPSVLAFGTYGDEKEISNDMPLIIKLKVL